MAEVRKSNGQLCEGSGIIQEPGDDLSSPPSARVPDA
jgi:hypothetical protein